MLKPLLMLAGLLGLSYMMADKEKIPEYTAELNRKAWPVAIAAWLLLGLFIVAA